MDAGATADQVEDSRGDARLSPADTVLIADAVARRLDRGALLLPPDLSARLREIDGYRYRWAFGSTHAPLAIEAQIITNGGLLIAITDAYGNRLFGREFAGTL